MTKPRFTPGQHEETGAQLAAIHDLLTEVCARVENAYPRTGPASPGVPRLDAALRNLDRARSALDDAFAREHPDAFTTRTYYPHPEDRTFTLGDPR